MNDGLLVNWRQVKRGDISGIYSSTVVYCGLNDFLIFWENANQLSLLDHIEDWYKNFTELDT